MRQGRIIRGIGGFYYISSGGKIYECKARGKFRLDDIKPLAGDEVLFEDGCIMDILPRKNCLLRPPCSNIDQVVIVLSAGRPKPDLLLADKLLLQASLQNIKPVLLLNKIDNADRDTLAGVEADYSWLGDAFIETSAKSQAGIEKLRETLSGYLSCFAGQSAVGKSTLINLLAGGNTQETGGLSKKTDRGRHTTRAAELLELPSGGCVVDTPGFSLLEIEIEPEDIQNHYPEFDAFKQGCRFAPCLHDAEPDCAVKRALENGKISRGRHLRYIELLKEAQIKRRNRYD